MEESSSRSGRNRGAAVEADAIGEQQLGNRGAAVGQSVSSSGSGLNRGAVEDLKQTQVASSARNRSAAAEAGAIGEQQLKRTQIGKQQLCTESCLAPDYTCRRTRGK